MPKEIILPVIAAGFEFGTIESWSKNEGDAVTKGEVLVSIETDKAIVEVESEESGILGKILVPAGTEDVPVNSIIGLLLQHGESVNVLESVLDSVASTMSPTISIPSPVIDEVPAKTKAVSGTRIAPPSEREGRHFSSPLAKKVAAKLDVDLSIISGRGPNGRVLKADVELCHANRSGSVSDEPIVTISSSEATPNRAYTVIPHTNMRKVIASRLTESKREVPHFYLSIDCRIDTLISMRKELNSSSHQVPEPYKLSVNDFVVKACGMAMRDVPAVNSSWTDEAIHQHHNVDISVAVAIEGGLITPIVQNVDSKGLVTISSQIKALAAKARTGRLNPSEYQGGGLTISNLGMYGITNFSAIINPPQSCILAVGAGDQRAIVIDGELVIANVMTCTLSADHRCVNGDDAAKFMGAFKRFIEEPFHMIMQ